MNAGIPIGVKEGHRIDAFLFFVYIHGMFKFPKNDERYSWTNHVGRKMMFYGLSADRIKRVIRHPKRMEEGIASGTLAAMQPAGTKQRPTEIWTMYAVQGKKKVIITAWRYPGISPIREQIPIPADIIEELEKEGVLSKHNSE